MGSDALLSQSGHHYVVNYNVAHIYYKKLRFGRQLPLTPM